MKGGNIITNVFLFLLQCITIMRVIRLYEKNTDERLLDEIANALKDGKIINQSAGARPKQSILEMLEG